MVATYPLKAWFFNPASVVSLLIKYNSGAAFRLDHCDNAVTADCLVAASPASNALDTAESERLSPMLARMLRYNGFLSADALSICSNTIGLSLDLSFIWLIAAMMAACTSAVSVA